MKRQEPLMEAAESSFRAAGISDCFCREVRWEHVELSEVNFFKTSLPEDGSGSGTVKAAWDYHKRRRGIT